MTVLHLFAGIAVIALPALAISPSAPALLHTTTSFDLLVHAPYEKAAPLFGPEGERAWAGKHWDPRFIYPQPAADIQGAVFTIQHGALKATWVTSLMDVEGRHFQYVYFLPDMMVTVIDVQFKAAPANATAVNVVYSRTALTPQGNEHVTAMTEGDQSSGSEWQKAIDEYLAGANPSTHP